MASAVTLTMLDAALLQRRDNFFTGGFLSVDHLAGPWETMAFLVASLTADAAVAGVAAAVMVRLFAVRLRPRALQLAALVAGMAPLVGVDILEYELMRYLGDVATAGLLLDLMGGNVREVLTVAMGHVLMPVALAASALAATVCLVILVHRRQVVDDLVRDAASASRAPWPGVWPLACMMLAAGLGGVTLASTTSNALGYGVSRKASGRALSLLASRLTDADRDGYGLTGPLPDTAPFDAGIHPFALDSPGNGIDEDSLAGDLPRGPSYRESGQVGGWKRRPDVVLFVLESFRADVVGAQLAGTRVTPVLDALADHGASSTRAYSPNGFTVQSRYHMLSGSLAEVRDGKSLVDDFRAQGYTVAYVSGWDETFRESRYDVGFARADIRVDARAEVERRVSQFSTAGSLMVPSHVLEEHVASLLDRPAVIDRPLMLYVNFTDAHFPYAHDQMATLVSAERLPRREITPEAKDRLWASYANAAANVDAAVGRVLARVREARGTEPAVIVTADHGESLFEDGLLGHGHALNDIQTRVPLIVANLPMTIREPFSHVNLRDAVHEALRVPPEAPATPHVVASGAPVFQYLGFLDRPRAIALTGADGRVTYDFRRGRVQVRGGAWVAPAALGESDRAAFTRVVQTWERAMLARAAR